jgi:putative DNA primase/helicase
VTDATPEDVTDENVGFGDGLDEWTRDMHKRIREAGIKRPNFSAARQAVNGHAHEDDPPPHTEIPEGITTTGAETDAWEEGGEPAPDDGLPALVIDESDPTATAKQLAARIAEQGKFLSNGYAPVQIVVDADGLPRAIEVTTETVRIHGHEVCSPVRMRKTKTGTQRVRAKITTDVARLYLFGLEGRWGLKPFRGITTAPILKNDGSIRVASGYDAATGLWCHNIPELDISEHPAAGEATAALQRLRQFFQTFPFADSPRQFDETIGGEITDLSQPPGLDESSFLAAYLTAVCRQSLELAPGHLCDAPAFSGAGSGKGLLQKAICISASVLTESPAMVRPMGHTKMVPLHTRTFIAITGNAVEISEDMARRILKTQLDAHMENPEQRRFEPGFLDRVLASRAELLSDALTIWRWGRQNKIKAGKPLGSYEQWALWCRDPLITLGGRDPVERIAEIKAADPKRRAVITLFEAWWACHGNSVIKATDLADGVAELIDSKPTRKADGAPQYSRQRLARYVDKLAGTRMGGYALIKLPKDETLSRPPTLYKLQRHISKEPA